jgi:two-component system response regulator MprA
MARTPIPTTVSHEPSVLVVEDDPIFRELLELALTSEGLRIASAENGERATRLLGSSSFDAIVLDLLMPVMDGLSFLRWLREERRSAMPVLVLTCLDQKKLAVEARVAGATDILVKPVALTKLVSRIRSLGHSAGRAPDSKSFDSPSGLQARPPVELEEPA